MEIKKMFPKKWAEFKKAIFQRDGHKCQFLKADGKKCNSKKRLVPHHILKKIDNPAIVFDPNNAITLCNYHHVHKVTGYEELYAPVFMRTVIENKRKAAK